jgi:hypothetical protein
MKKYLWKKVMQLEACILQCTFFQYVDLRVVELDFL